MEAGWATEANPLMAMVLQRGVEPFLGVKLLLGMSAVLVFKAYGHRPLARFGVAVGLFAYVFVAAIHLSQGAAQLSTGTLFAVR